MLRISDGEAAEQPKLGEADLGISGAKRRWKEHGKIKLDVNKTLEFLNEKMRF